MAAGTAVADEPLVLARDGFFYVGGKTMTVQGREFVYGQMYVEIRIPALKQCIAVVITPDGKRIFISNYNMWKVMAYAVPAWYRARE